VYDPVNGAVSEVNCVDDETVFAGSRDVTCVELETMPVGVPVKLAYGNVPVCDPENDPVNDPDVDPLTYRDPVITALPL
jgi:hypothetical protein